MIEDKRKSKRIPLPTPIRYQIKGSQKFSNTMGKDISDHGIGFLSNDFLPITTELICELQHPERPYVIKAEAKVVWISNQKFSDRFYVGSKFTAYPQTI